MSVQHFRRPMLATVRGKPATQAERDAIAFKPIPINLQWSDEEWERGHLVSVRVAAEIVARTPARLQDAISKLAPTGHLHETLDGLIGTKEHLESMIRLLETAIVRSFLVLERLGYSPDNPPPDSRDGPIGGAA
jgi:hypothetical protein